jgi:hypothetical protein
VAIDMSRNAVSQRLNEMGELWLLSAHLMNSKLGNNGSCRPIQSRALEIRDSIRKVLLFEWDPIGICCDDAQLDEYDAYIAPIYRILVGTRSEDEVIERLAQIERNELGVGPTKTELLQLIARKLLTLEVGINQM